jgi:multiple sugar transport system substrate-binding protein
MLNTDRALAAAHYLMELLDYSPPDILSMSWYERVRPYAAGKVAMAYGYTLLAPYFELDDTCPAMATPATCRIRTVPRARPSRRSAATRSASPQPRPGTHERRGRGARRLHVARRAEALCPERQPHRAALLRRCRPRGAPPVAIFETVDQMSWRDELQFWPRPPIPQISGIIDLCGNELHDMLRGLVTPREALDRHRPRPKITQKTSPLGRKTWTPIA